MNQNAPVDSTPYLKSKLDVYPLALFSQSKASPWRSQCRSTHTRKERCQGLSFVRASFENMWEVADVDQWHDAYRQSWRSIQEQMDSKKARTAHELTRSWTSGQPGLCRDVARVVAEYANEGVFADANCRLASVYSYDLVCGTDGHAWQRGDVHGREVITSTHFAHAVYRLPIDPDNHRTALLDFSSASGWKFIARTSLADGSLLVLGHCRGRTVCCQISTSGQAKFLWSKASPPPFQRHHLARVVAPAGKTELVLPVDDKVLCLIDASTGEAVHKFYPFENHPADGGLRTLFQCLGRLTDDLLVVAEGRIPFDVSSTLASSLAVAIWSRRSKTVVASWRLQDKNKRPDNLIFVFDRTEELRWLVCCDAGVHVLRYDVWTGQLLSMVLLPDRGLGDSMDAASETGTIVLLDRKGMAAIL